MSSALARFAPLRLLRRAVALGCAVLVLVLGWLAADSGAHASLHAAAGCPSGAACAHPGHAPDDSRAPEPGAPCDDPACVVTRFLVGATDAVTLAVLPLLGALAALAARWQVVESGWTRAAFARVAPSCGPPAAA
jgi:hypothetical protein